MFVGNRPCAGLWGPWLTGNCRSAGVRREMVATRLVEVWCLGLQCMVGSVRANYKMLKNPFCTVKNTKYINPRARQEESYSCTEVFYRLCSAGPCLVDWLPWTAFEEVLVIRAGAIVEVQRGGPRPGRAAAGARALRVAPLHAAPAAWSGRGPQLAALHRVPSCRGAG